MAKLKKLTEQEMVESKNRFKLLLEYSFVNQEKDLLLDEDDDIPGDPNQPDPNAAGGEQPLAPADQDPQPETGEVPPMEQGNEAPPMEQPAEIPPMGMEAQPEMEEPADDSVEVDITDLTNTQQDVDAKVSGMADQNQQMMDMLSQLSDKIENIVKNSDSEMAKIKDEIIKRNPTPVEVLQKRIVVSDPFNQTPADYWSKKEGEGHYKLEDDEEFELKSSDIDGSPSEVYKSFGMKDDEINQSLSSMFNF